MPRKSTKKTKVIPVKPPIERIDLVIHPSDPLSEPRIYEFSPKITGMRQFCVLAEMMELFERHQAPHPNRCD